METIESPDLRRKVRKNLMVLFIISSIMFFAGLISAYIVSKGDVFWMKVKVPNLFFINTGILLLVSVLIHLALKKIKQGNQKAIKGLLGLALALGLTFFVLQIKAWGIMLDRGIHPVNKNIVINKGRYADYFTIEYKGQELGLNGNQYLLGNDLFSEGQMEEMQTFAKQFLSVKQPDLNVPDYGQTFIVKFKGEPMTYIGNKLMLGSKQLSGLNFERLQDLMLNIREGRGDFFAKGTYGEDFTMYYKGLPVDYKDRVFYYKGKELSVPMKLSLTDSDDKANAYFYLITVAHWIHVLAGVLVLMTLFFRSLKGKYTQEEYAGIAVGGMFWHFLDVLWLFLFLFLLLIH